MVIVPQKYVHLANEIQSGIGTGQQIDLKSIDTWKLYKKNSIISSSLLSSTSEIVDILNGVFNRNSILLIRRKSIFFKVMLFLFPYLLAVLVLPCFVQVFSNYGESGLFLVVVLRLLILMTSLVAEHRLQASRLQELQLMSSIVVAHGLSCFMACGIFLDQGFLLCCFSMIFIIFVLLVE